MSEALGGQEFVVPSYDSEMGSFPGDKSLSCASRATAVMPDLIRHPVSYLKWVRSPYFQVWILRLVGFLKSGQVAVGREAGRRG